MLMLKSVSSKEFDLPKQLQVLWRREIQSVCVCASVALLMRRYASGRVRYVGLCTGSTCVPRHAQYGALFQFLKVLKCSQGTLTPTIWCDMCNRISKVSMKLGPVKLLRLNGSHSAVAARLAKLQALRLNRFLSLLHCAFRKIQVH